MDIKAIELKGDRIKLCPMKLSHVDELYEAGQSSEIWTYSTCRVSSKNDMEHFVRSALLAMEQGQELPFVIYDTKLEKLVGSTRYLNISIPNRNLEIGWTWYSPQVWRTYVNTEAKYLLLRHCFETLEAVRVQFKADSRNLRSLQAIQRLGAVKEGVLRQDKILPDGYIRDSSVFSIIREEWPTTKLHLEEALSR